MRKFKILFIAIVSIFLFFSFSENTKAQSSCGGLVSCQLDICCPNGLCPPFCTAHDNYEIQCSIFPSEGTCNATITDDLCIDNSNPYSPYWYVELETCQWGGGGGGGGYCGDGLCNNGETCSTCQNDCGPCGECYGVHVGDCGGCAYVDPCCPANQRNKWRYCTDSGWSGWCEADDTCATPPPTPTPLPCPTGFSVSCAPSGAQATISWNNLPGAVAYFLRANRIPYDDWYNGAAGDYAGESTTTYQTFTTTPGYEYTYDVQGKKAGEAWPYSGLRCPFLPFTCSPPPPSCTITLSNGNTYVGGTVSLSAGVSVVGGTISNVSFSSGNTGVATVSPASDATSPYNTTATGVSGGTATITSTATMNTGTTCTDTSTVTVRACTLNLTPATQNVLVGNTLAMSATANVIPSGTISSVSFASNATSVVTVSPANDTTSPYGTTATAVSDGVISRSATITATANISGGGTCVDTSVITVPACSLSLVPSSLNMKVGDAPYPFTATLSSINSTGNSVSFSSNNTSSVTVSPASDNSSPYITNATAVAPGTATLTAQAYRSGVAKCPPDTSIVNVTWADPWWQVKDADVSTNGDLESSIPLPIGSYYFDLLGNGAFPGIPAYGGLTNTLNGNNVSEKGWLANSSYNATKRYDYNYFNDAIPSDITPAFIASDTVNGSYFTSGGTPDSQGNYWYKYNGGSPTFTIQSGVNLGARKVILYVENANVNLQGNIGLNDGSGFFLLITNRGITVAPGVTDLEGIFVSDLTFNTGIASAQLRVRGTVVAYGGIQLSRNLNSGNTTTAAELFELAPDLILHFPIPLGIRNMTWQEVAP